MEDVLIFDLKEWVHRQITATRTPIGAVVAGWGAAARKDRDGQDPLHTGAVSDVQTYGDRRPYAVPDRLADLTGPASGHVVLPAELGWTGRIDYDLDDPADAAVLYERVLVDAVRTQDVTRLLNAGRLRLLWSRLFLPTRVRHLWETRFSDLSAAA